MVFSPTKEVVTFDGIDGSVSAREKREVAHVDDSPAHVPPRLRPPYSWLRDPQVPLVLLMYVQLLCNVVLSAAVAYLFYVCAVTLRADINHRIEMYTDDALMEISLCSRDYYRNKCLAENGARRPPALEEQCLHWEKCMNRDPLQLARLQIGAEAVAEVINAFFRRVSWKAVVLLIGVIVASFVMTNAAFGRSRQLVELQRLDSLERRLAEQSVQLGQMTLDLTVFLEPPLAPMGRILDDIID